MEVFHYVNFMENEIFMSIKVLATLGPSSLNENINLKIPNFFIIVEPSYNFLIFYLFYL